MAYLNAYFLEGPFILKIYNLNSTNIHALRGAYFKSAGSDKKINRNIHCGVLPQPNGEWRQILCGLVTVPR